MRHFHCIGCDAAFCWAYLLKKHIDKCPDRGGRSAPSHIFLSRPNVADTPGDALDRLTKKDIIPSVFDEVDMRLTRASLGIRGNGPILQDPFTDDRWMGIFRVKEFGHRAASSQHVVLIYDIRPSFWILNCRQKGEARRFASNEGVLALPRIGSVTLAFCLRIWSIFSRRLKYRGSQEEYPS